MTTLRGVLAAAVTPLMDGGARIDEDGIGHVARFLADAGADGALVCGTAGEGMVLSVAERQRALEAYIPVGGARLGLMAHCGAQATAGAIGAISALASAFPELVASAVAAGTPEAAERARTARVTLERFPMPAALKVVCGLRGVPITAEVRAPLRTLDATERGELEAAVRGLLDTVPA